MNSSLDRKLRPEMLLRVFGVAFFAYLFFGFMLLPCLNTLPASSAPKTRQGRRIPSRSSVSSWQAR